MMFLTPGTGFSGCCGVARRTVAPQVRSTSVAPSPRMAASMSRPISSLSGQAGVVRSTLRATDDAIDADVLDHVQADDVAMELGVLDVAERVPDGGLGEHGRYLTCALGIDGLGADTTRQRAAAGRGPPIGRLTVRLAARRPAGSPAPACAARARSRSARRWPRLPGMPELLEEELHLGLLAGDDRRPWSRGPRAAA